MQLQAQCQKGYCDVAMQNKELQQHWGITEEVQVVQLCQLKMRRKKNTQKNRYFTFFIDLSHFHRVTFWTKDFP